jgi:serine/threonine-protein kinase
MESNHLARIEPLFQELLDLSPAARAARLDLRCGSNAELHGELASLLSAYEHVSTVFGALDRTGPPARAAEGDAEPIPLPTHGRYWVVRELGRGGMGIVYLAEDRQLQRPVALKFLSARLGEDPAARALLMAETIADIRR